MERPPSRSSYGRTASRSSTSTTNTRATMHTAHSALSSSQAPGSPNLSQSQHSHRLYHATCQRPTSTIPRTTTRTPRLTREASSESTRQTVISSFLQEKLQQSRMAESDRSTTWSRSTDVNSSGEFSRSLGSPIKNLEADGHRPNSAAGSESNKKKGLGVKDMEQVISSLHKKNFDLKLELYHRRERQTALEDKVEALEVEKSRAEEMNDHLSQELEKRDKAIEEAVAMIVTLEARLEQYAKERSIIEQIEAEGQYAAPTFDPCYEDPRPATQSPDMMKQMGSGKAINRMPSFLSDHSETTENLRNVYLGTRGSILSLAQVPEGSNEADNGRNTALGSPSLSVLSESSFVSVYGSKEHDSSGMQDVDEPLALDGADSLPAKASTINRPKTAFVKSHASPNRSTRSNSLSTRQAQFDSINNVIEYNSPARKSDRSYASKKVEERPQGRDKDGADVFTGRSAMPVNHRRTKEEKRESLRRVITDAPGGVRLHDQNLPPTPDTISTSTLRRFQNSSDTLSKHPTMQRSHGALSETSENEGSMGMHSGVQLQEPMRAVKASAHIIDLNNRAYAENRGRSIQRPRSADETTISNRRGTMYGAGGASIGTDSEMIRNLFPVQQELFSASLPPPPPNRRSSLNAQTVAQLKISNPSRPPANPKASKSGRKKGHQRRNSDDIQMRAEIQAQAPPAGEQKKNHYPPISGQPAQNKFAKFFRRSSTTAPSPTPTSETGPTEPPSNGLSSSVNSASGLPPWISRTGVADEDRDSATPPPIMRSSRHGRHTSVDVGDDSIMSQEPGTPGTPRMDRDTSEQVDSPRAGGKRRWFGLKNKQG
ncbi:hypothetical protein FOC1_g10005089 [Fusarium oxysporum f. sp. cubense race 1]|uniref:Centrosomin N-terminal motif 1 domain-containing protein n=1 Tax=Fusarium oxysporum f. sp. cubense (strain race 1) TaxID=1229664 RepID=N4U4H2_FUSC1|nr:hypothetical protein FOC1_g10005089 [Fusarium oxysporum f. sp. cubense race 1]